MQVSISHMLVQCMGILPLLEFHKVTVSIPTQTWQCDCTILCYYESSGCMYNVYVQRNELSDLSQLCSSTVMLIHSHYKQSTCACNVPACAATCHSDNSVHTFVISDTNYARRYNPSQAENNRKIERLTR